jgi:pimeloyl-ACP methyl ester carboxylesterase
MGESMFGRSAAALVTVFVLTGVPRAQELAPPPGRMVDIGGRRLHLHCTGSGSPTTLLEAGASSFALDWALVQPAIAATTRVCSYDRAGQGWSDAAPPGETPEGIVADLHTLLGIAGEKPPYILVGASFGALLARLYTVRYPEDVAGLVFVDPAHEDDLFTMVNGQPRTIASLTEDEMRSTLPTTALRIQRRSPQTGAPFDRLPPDLYETRVQLETKLIASVPETVPAESAASVILGQWRLLALLRERSAEGKPALGARPVVVLTRGMQLRPDLRAAHSRLAAASSNSRHTVIAGAGHEIHLFQPQAVIEAIGDVIGAHRTGKPLNP